MREGLRGLSKEKTPFAIVTADMALAPGWSARCAMTLEIAPAITSGQSTKESVRRVFSLWEQMPLKIISGDAEVNEAKLAPSSTAVSFSIVERNRPA